MPDQFEIIYKAHYNNLRNTVENIINDKDASHDVVQEVFLKLWNKKDEMDRILDPKAYLFRSVINASLTYLENNKKRVYLSDIKIASIDNTDENILLKELEIKIQAAIDNLPPKCKVIFVLCRFENMKHKEIAQHLSISLKTVENQMGIAIKRLNHELKPYLNKGLLPL
ncbi:MAG: RNA polymerase sigma-70 factor [Bacteroidota bacterium]|nr:RNA polymerase sigma-70 factor [Bacteroidota bacterium]